MKRLFILINIISIAFPINAQTHYQLRDSIIKYENIDPNKAIEFSVAYTGITQNVEIDSLLLGLEKRCDISKWDLMPALTL